MKSTLLQDDNYGQEGDYFVTICTSDFECFLGEQEGQDIRLTKSGRLAEKYLLQIPEHFINVVIKEYVIMPNHIHLILSLQNIEGYEGEEVKDDVSRFELAFGMMIGRKNPFLLRGNIFHLIMWFKAASLIEIRRNFNPDFSWKQGYYDLIIKNETSFQNIKDYIRFNPQNWEDDLDNPSNKLRDFIFPDHM